MLAKADAACTRCVHATSFTRGRLCASMRSPMCSLPTIECIQACLLATCQEAPPAIIPGELPQLVHREGCSAQPRLVCVCAAGAWVANAARPPIIEASARDQGHSAQVHTQTDSFILEKLQSRAVLLHRVAHHFHATVTIEGRQRGATKAVEATLRIRCLPGQDLVWWTNTGCTLVSGDR